VGDRYIGLETQDATLAAWIEVSASGVGVHTQVVMTMTEAGANAGLYAPMASLSFPIAG